MVHMPNLHSYPVADPHGLGLTTVRTIEPKKHEHAFICASARAESWNDYFVILCCSCGEVKFVPYPKESK